MPVIIREGKEISIYPNKTHHYLSLLLYKYGADFLSLYNDLHKLGIFISNQKVDIDLPQKENMKLHVLLSDGPRSAASAEDFIGYCNYASIEIEFFSNGRDKVITVPLKNDTDTVNSVAQFIQGNYSKMFNSDEIVTIAELIPWWRNTTSYHVICRTEKGRDNMVKETLKYMDHEIEPNDIVGEYAWPPIYGEEVLNSDEQNQTPLRKCYE